MKVSERHVSLRVAENDKISAQEYWSGSTGKLEGGVETRGIYPFPGAQRSPLRESQKSCHPRHRQPFQRFRGKVGKLYCSWAMLYFTIYNDLLTGMSFSGRLVVDVTFCNLRMRKGGRPFDFEGRRNIICEVAYECSDFMARRSYFRPKPGPRKNG